MIFLTSTGMTFLDLIDLKEISFNEVVDSIYKNTNTCYFKTVIEALRKYFSCECDTFGKTP